MPKEDIVYFSPFMIMRSLRREDLDEAREYLAEENMAEYLFEKHEEYKDFIKSIRWILEDVGIGTVEIRSSHFIENEDVRKELLYFIENQDIDGLGEGFTQRFESEDGEPALIVPSGTLTRKELSKYVPGSGFAYNDNKGESYEEEEE